MVLGFLHKSLRPSSCLFTWSNPVLRRLLYSELSQKICLASYQHLSLYEYGWCDGVIL